MFRILQQVSERRGCFRVKWSKVANYTLHYTTTHWLHYQNASFLRVVKTQTKVGVKFCTTTHEELTTLHNAAPHGTTLCGAVWCSVLQCAAVCCVAVCCSVLQCVAVCCSVQCECCSVLQCVAVCCSVLQCVAVCCSVVQNAQVFKICIPRSCCSVLQCVAVCCSVS